MIDIEAIRKRLAEQSAMVERYYILKQVVLLLETHNSIQLDIGELEVKSTGGVSVPPTAAANVPGLLTRFIEDEWDNGNLQDQFMNWLGEQIEPLERALK